MLTMKWTRDTDDAGDEQSCTSGTASCNSCTSGKASCMLATRRPSESLARNCDDDQGDGDDGDNDDDGDGDHDDDDGVNLFVGFTTFNTLLRYENKLLKVRPLSRKVPCCKTCSFGISGVVVGGRGGTTGVSSRTGRFHLHCNSFRNLSRGRTRRHHPP